MIVYEDGEKRYIIAPKKIKLGDRIVYSQTAEIKAGNCLPLTNIPIGTLIHNVELKPGKGGQLSRSAGCSAKLTAKEGAIALIKLRSGEVRKILSQCKAVIGEVSNETYALINWGKAGRIRYKGIRPTVRGVVMNPVDHPHGGGEGKTSGGRHPCSPWGFSAKGSKTRNKFIHIYIFIFLLIIKSQFDELEKGFTAFLVFSKKESTLATFLPLTTSATSIAFLGETLIFFSLADAIIFFIISFLLFCFHSFITF